MARPEKLPSIALGVVWGMGVLTLAEKIVAYHDWVLDQGGADGAFISHESLSLRLGRSLSAATISATRQRLKRLTLHEALRRPDARNMGWVLTLPPQFIPRAFREVPGLSGQADQYVRALAAWQAESGRHVPGSPERPYQAERSPRTTQDGTRATALGGNGGVTSRLSMRETQLPSAVTSTSEKQEEKGVGALAPQDEKQAVDHRSEWRAWMKLQRGETLTSDERELVRAYQHRLEQRETA